MLCILCLTAPDQIIEIFNEEGISLNACGIISKHFWLKPDAGDPDSKVICRSCWNAVDSFHNFFQMIEEAHTTLSTTDFLDESKASDDDDNHSYPELVATEYDIKSEPIDDTKLILKVHENVEEENSVSDNRGQKTCPTHKSPNSPKPHTKVKIKSEDNVKCETESTMEEKNQSISDSDSEVPLSRLNSKRAQKNSILNDTKDDGGNVEKCKKYEKKKVPCQKFDEVIRENIKLSCNICEKPLSNFFVLKEHYQSVHNETGYVICCEKKFDSRHGLVHHILLHNDPDRFKCDICGRILANKKSLKFHTKTHIKKEKTFSCEKCKRCFSRKEKLENHMKNHVRPERICEQCGKVTRSLKDHQLREHSDIPKEPVQCPKCQKYLSDNSSLRRHVKFQHPETETLNVCNICGKISSSGYGLQRHIFNMHKVERRHKCTMCEKAFKFAHILRPDANDVNARVICTPCWCALESFHKFYLQVERAHTKLRVSIEKSDLKLENDNIAPQDVDQTVGQPFDEVATDLLNADIKLEVPEDIEVTLLPEVASAQTDKKEESLEERKHSTDSEVSIEIDAPPASSTRSRTSAEKSYAEVQSSSDDEKDHDNTTEWQNQNSDNDDEDSDYVDSSSKTSKGAETLSTTKKRGRPKKSESRDTPRKRKRASEEQSKKMERIQEYDELIAKNMKLTCSICLNISPNFAVLKKHYRVAHNECGYATCCGKKFRKRGVLVDHIYTHQNPEYFKCEKCGKVLANRKCLDCHMLTHDTEKQRIYQCDQCTMSFYTRPLLTRHLQTHIAVRNIKCPDCDKFFSTQDILRTHINNVHNSAYNRICDQCGKLFRRPDAFRRHQLEHDGITQPLVPCEKCNVKLTSKYGLKRHMESMHPETEVTHVCSTCGKVAPSAAALQRHISYMHKMERKYKCPMCDKAFKKTGGLKPNKDDENARYICSSCWGSLDSFHKFYQQVEEAHVNLVRTSNNASDVLKQETEQIVIPTELEETEKFNPVSDFLTADVKLEVKDDGEVNLQQYDPLPDIEQKIDVSEITNPKRQKLSESLNSDDSESEIPLANLAKTRSRKTSKVNAATVSTNDEAESGAEWQDNNTADDDEEDESEFEVKKTPKRKAVTSTGKKRGRPCKNAPKNNTPKQTTEEQIKKRELSQEYDEIIHKNIKLTCNLCLLPLANFFILKKHYRSKHNERGYALCCGKKFLKRGILVDHIYTHLNPEHFKCDKCDKVLADRRCLEVHMNTHITEKQRIYQCDQCCKSFFKKPLLTRHMHIHIPEEERKFPCEECNKFFPSNYTLRAHINNVHQNAYAKICDQCGKSIRGREAFQRHLLEHAGIPIPSVQCDKCGAKLKNKYGLKRHMNSMHAESSVPHVCNICGKIAPNPAALQRHYSYVHKCERNHKCPMCDKAFKKAGGLKEHMTTHTGEVLYTCPHCPKTFNSNANMHSHRKKMHRKEWEENRRHPHMGATASTE